MSTPPRTTGRLLAASLSLAAGGAVLTAAPAAFALSENQVTIKADGTDLSGTITSANKACKDDRKVIVFKQVGTRGGGDDQKFATDVSELSGGVGVWSTGNTGTEGRFYARIRKTDACKADSSPTVKAQSND